MRSVQTILFLMLLMFCLSVSWAVDLKRQLQPMIPLGHTDGIYAVTFSSDGKLAFSLSYDQSLKVWEVASGREVKSYKMDADHVRAVAVSPDNYWVVSGDRGRGLKLWDVATGRKIQRFQGHDRQVNSLVFSPTGQLLASAGNDRRIKIWDVSSGRLLRQKRLHGKAIRQVIFSADGRQIISAGDDRKIIVSDARTLKKQAVLRGHQAAVRAIAVSADGKYLLSAGADKLVLMWDLASRKIIRRFAGHTKAVNSVAFSPDGTLILSASDDQSMILWDSRSGDVKQKFTGHQGKVLDAAFAPNNFLILSGSSDRTLRLWGTAHANEIKRFDGLASRLNAVAVSADQRYLFSAHRDRTLKLWDLKKGQAIRIFSRHNRSVNDVVFSSDSRYAASAGDDNRIMVWHVEDGRRLRRFSGHRAAVNQVLFSADNTAVLSASADSSIKLWSLSKYRLLKTYNGHQRAVLSIALHPDGKHFISSAKDNTIRLWDMESGTSRVIFRSPYPVRRLQYVNGGRQFVSAGWKLILHQASSGDEIRVLGNKKTAHTSDITALALSADGRLLASGSYDNQIKIWSMENYRQLFQFQVPQAGILSLAFADNSSHPQLVSAGGDGVIRIWDLQTRAEELRLVGSKDGEWISMTPDGYYDHSPEGSQLIHWVRSQGISSFSFEQFEAVFRRPQVIHQRLGGDHQAGLPTPPMPEPPWLDFEEHLKTRIVLNNSVDLRLQVHDSEKVDQVRVYVNGRLQIKQQVGSREKDLHLKLRLPTTVNQVTIISLNHKGLSSDPRYLSVLSPDNHAGTQNLHLLSIGVSQYEKLGEELQLNYAHSDAQNFSRRFSRAGEKMYQNILRHELLNQQVTIDLVVEKLSDLTRKVGPNDTLMVFFAGHGFKQADAAKGEVFYMATHDLDMNNLEATALTWDILSQYLHQIRGQVILFLDACHSGSISNQAIVPNNYLAEKLFSREKGGFIIFSAAKGRQFAQESASFGSGEGLFSYAIAKAIAQDEMKTDKNGNGYIEFFELAEAVQHFVDKQSDGQQTPWVSHKQLFGDVPVVKVLESGF